MTSSSMTGRRWTTADEVRAKVRRKWEDGTVPRAVATDESSVFPWRIPLAHPSGSELTDRFDEARRWVADLRRLPHGSLEFAVQQNRQVGANDVPVAFVVPDADAAAALAGTRRQLADLRSVVRRTVERAPAFLSHLAARPLEYAALAGAWDQVLDVADWLGAHPAPGIHLRQMPVPGVHTKFVEANAVVIARVLDVVHSHALVEAGVRPQQFAERYGFLTKPRLIRFRHLDPARRAASGQVDGDVTVSSSDFARLPSVPLVFVTENETNFLAFPDAPDALVVFGAGKGLRRLGEVLWLTGVRVVYWGDIDTHGFTILDELRSWLPHAESMLMDAATLQACQAFWGTEPTPVTRDLTRLTAAEAALYDDLRYDRIAPGLRLEQEFIPFPLVQTAVRTRSTTGSTGL